MSGGSQWQRTQLPDSVPVAGGRMSGGFEHRFHPVKLVTWNCAKMARHKVPVLIERLARDVAVISECCDVASLRHELGPLLPECTMAWVGRDPSCGLAVLGFGPWRLELDEEARALVDGMKWVCPVRIDGPAPFRLLGVWANNSTKRRPATEAVRALGDWPAPDPSVVAGDFNNDSIWDRGAGDERDHTVMVDLLSERGLQVVPNRSPTFHQSKNPQKPYVLDHVFVPDQRPVGRLEVGPLDKWTSLSDHLPLSVEVDLGIGVGTPG